MPFTHTKRILIDRTKCGSVDTTDYPLAFFGTFADLATVAKGGHVTSNSGYDIVFAADSAGVTPYPFELVSYNPTTGAVVFFVKVPTLSASVDTALWVLSGNSSISTYQGNNSGTWDSDYLGVWHCGPGAISNDSTANARSGTAGTGWQGLAGWAAANGISLPPSVIGNTGAGNISGGINFPSTGMPAGDSPFTCESWFYANANAWQSIISWGQNVYPAIAGEVVDMMFAPGSPGWISGGYGLPNLGATVPVHTWFHFAIVYDGATLTLYLNGVLVGTQSFVYNVVLSTSCGVAQSSAFSGDSFNAAVTEPRASRINRSPSYILANYNNQSSPGTFFSIDNGATLAQRGNIAYNQIRSSDRTGSGNQLLTYSLTPATHASPGVAGQIAFDDTGFFYWCYATNSWARIGPGGYTSIF